MGQNLPGSILQKPRMIIKKDACMIFYDASKPSYLETDSSSVSLGAGLLHLR